MILAVDIGNTNIVIGGFEQDKLKFVSRISTDKKLMKDQYKVQFNQILQLYGHDKSEFTGAIISSVVPPLLPTVKGAVAELLKCEVTTVSPGTKTGLNIKIDNPAVLGSDLVCAAVGAIKNYEYPCIIVDLGTATKFSAIDKNASFIGASILPGISISLDALSEKTAQLPHINFSDTSVVIGKNTVESMKSGIVFGTASMIDGMIDRFIKEMGECSVVATGGFAKSIIPYCSHDIKVDEDLILLGLYEIYRKSH